LLLQIPGSNFMPDSISCPHCQRVLQMPASFAGGEVRCPICANVFGGDEQTGITTHAPQPIPPLTALAVPDKVADALPHVCRLRGDTPDHDHDLLDRAAPGRSFTPSGRLGLAVKILLGLNILLNLLMTVSAYLHYDFATRWVSQAHIPKDEVTANIISQQLLTIANRICLIPTAIVFVIWFHRAHANLKSLGARNLASTPAWAVACWFVPILQLYRPTQIAQEIWRNSDPHAPASVYRRRATSANSTRINYWWGLWMISLVSGYFSASSLHSANSPQSLQDATVVSIIDKVATTLAALLALAMVIGIDDRQLARAEMLRARLRENEQLEPADGPKAIN
jgi:hypothetical protein